MSTIGLVSKKMDNIIIRSPKRFASINFFELWRYRELFYIFTWRDIKVRYKQTTIGIAWAILQPFLLMLVFSVFFGSFANIPSDGVPYPIFVFSGLIFWNYFSNALISASNSLVENENIVKKIYFPRLILPLSTTITPLVDFCIACMLLLCMLFYYHLPIHANIIIFLPLLLFMTFLTAAGLGTFLSAVNVRYRDVRYALPFFIQLLLFVTPVIYPVSLVGSKYRLLLSLNPMSGIIGNARSIILGSTSIDFPLLFISGGLALVLFIFGIYYFRKTERIFADVA